MKSIHAILIGLGMVGSDIVKTVPQKESGIISGIFDVNPGLIGKPAGTFWRFLH